MILILKDEVSRENAERLANAISGFLVQDGRWVIATSAKNNSVPPQFEDLVDRCLIFESDFQLSSKIYKPEKRVIKIGSISLGNDHRTLLIAGPCAVENFSQLEETAHFVKSLGVKILRAGAYKPRTSPYTFQGLGLEGLKMLAKIKELLGLLIITEVRDATHLNEVAEISDIIQIGAKAMYDHAILRFCGKSKKPVLLKRHFGATLQEFLQAAEFILSSGNFNVILCERGIRTFETKTRFTLDLCGVMYLKEHCNLPIVVDPSHAMGNAYGVPDLAKACSALGVDGIMIEVHPNPKAAMSDAEQQLSFTQFSQLVNDLHELAKATAREII